MKQILNEDRIMYRTTGGKKLPEGWTFKFKPTLLQKIFGYKTFDNFILLEDSDFGLNLPKVKVPAGAVFEYTAWGALVSECIAIN